MKRLIIEELALTLDRNRKIFPVQKEMDDNYTFRENPHLMKNDIP